MRPPEKKRKGLLLVLFKRKLLSMYNPSPPEYKHPPEKYSKKKLFDEK